MKGPSKDRNSDWFRFVAPVLFVMGAAGLRAADSVLPLRLGDRVLLSGEAGLAWFDSGRLGRYPENEFVVDEARLFIDVKVTDRAFLFTELNLAERELGAEEGVQLGELYVEFADVQEWWGGRSPFALRAGRCDIPFGEEYLTRDTIDNPFISHSLADVWGVDEGIEAFGRIGAFDYIVAVQNGGYQKSGDADGDKAVVGRVGLEPATGLRLSASAMRTGDISVQGDELAEVWFGNSYIGPLGSPDTTTTFGAELFQFDARYAWEGGHVAGSAGGIRYTDDDSATDNDSDGSYWSVELVQRIHGPWYAGLRYSAIVADKVLGAPGQAEFLEETNYGAIEDIWRVSADLGCRVNRHLLWKIEYSHEDGTRADGDAIEDQDFAGAEIAVAF